MTSEFEQNALLSGMSRQAMHQRPGVERISGQDKVETGKRTGSQCTGSGETK